MCKNCTCKTKTISRRVYTETNKEFFGKKGLLYPIYANRVISPLYDKNYERSGTINNVINLMNGHESCSNKVIGYFSALPVNDGTSTKFATSMSFCVPSDYDVFNRLYAKFSAMRKCLSGNGLKAHIDRHQQVIAGNWHEDPIYYFGYGYTVADQFDAFLTKCNKYYHK